MKKKIIVLALCVLMISGCGKIPKLSNGDEAIVTLKDGSMVSANELYEEVKKSDATLDKMIEMVDKKILEEEYKDKLDEARSDVDDQMAMLEQTYGDQLDALIKQNTNYSTAAEYKEALYLNALRQFAINDYCKKQVTEKQIKKYYEDEIVSDIKVSHILITSKATDAMTDEEKKAAEAEAKEKAQSIISELNKTDKSEVAAKFAELASAQSDDAATKNNGGSFGYINKDTLSSEYDELVDAAYSLKDGEYSTKVVTTELGYHVILRTDTKEKASLDDVRDTIVEDLAQEYLAKNTVSYVKALQEIRKEKGFEIVDSDLKSRYAAYIQEELNYYQQIDEQQNQTNK
ncbi:MAG: peptidylprolyl isomerase [Bacilli bacterium]|nr:peptidylprolyl isomerase [Bacilli bacterium]